MAQNQVVAFTSGVVPAHIQKALEKYKNIPDRVTIDQLSFRGKVFRSVIDGEEHALVNSEGEPVGTVHVVVLNANKAKSRSFYEGAYEEGKSKPPVCWSLDGEKPDPSVAEPVSSTCAKCPNAVKGSKITPNGKETTACSTYKRLVVVPLANVTAKAGDPDIEADITPLLLRVPQTSMWDKNNEENEAKGYYAWDQYVDMLRKQGATHTGLVATKIRFDSRMAYPKLLFAASRWLVQEEIDVAAPMYESEDVMKMLQASETVAAVRKPKEETTEESDEPEQAVVAKPAKAAPVEDEDDAPPPPKSKSQEKRIAAQKAAPVEDEEEEVPAPKPKAKAKAAPVEDEEDEAPPPPKAKAKAKAAPVEEEEAPAPKAKAKAAPKSDLSDLIEEFTDD